LQEKKKMSLADKINDGLKTAMKNKEKDKLAVLRAVKSELLLHATKGGDGSITEAEEMKILTKLYKQRNESAALYTEQGREDLAQEEEFQASVIEEFLPKQMSEAEIEAKVDQIITDTGAEGMKDMGKVMGQANAAMAGKADGSVVAKIVKARLSS
jgi:uncharacterized protein YqeY